MAQLNRTRCNLLTDPARALESERSPTIISRSEADTLLVRTGALASADRLRPSLRRGPSAIADIIYEGRDYTSYAYLIRPNRPMG